MSQVPSVLFVIPHYFGKKTTATWHGAFQKSADQRASILRRTVSALHQCFGERQCMMQLDQRRTEAANVDIRFRVKVIVCTSGEDHLLDSLGLGSQSLEQHKSQREAAFLGYACHDVMQAASGQYDWYGYLEVDLLLQDPLLFAKSSWFSGIAGEDAVLLPNRFEQTFESPAHKAYVDGDLSTAICRRRSVDGDLSTAICRRRSVDASDRSLPGSQRSSHHCSGGIRSDLAFPATCQPALWMLFSDPRPAGKNAASPHLPIRLRQLHWAAGQRGNPVPDVGFSRLQASASQCWIQRAPAPVDAIHQPAPHPRVNRLGLLPSAPLRGLGPPQQKIDEAPVDSGFRCAVHSWIGHAPRLQASTAGNLGCHIKGHRQRHCEGELAFNPHPEDRRDVWRVYERTLGASVT